MAQRVRNDLHILSEPNVSGGPAGPLGVRLRGARRPRKENISTSGGNRLNLGRGPFLVVNPEITFRSEPRFTLWDDCMSFPWLMVRLRRHVQIDLTFQNERGDLVEWNKLELAISELVQHEVDHLNGILAVDHALDRDSIIARRLYEERKELFDRQVDYFIAPTIPSGSGSFSLADRSAPTLGR